MNTHSESEPHGKVHPETIPTVENNHVVEHRVGVVEKVPTKTETVTTSTSHLHSTKPEKSNDINLPILGAIACCIPLAGILGYLLHQPHDRVVTRTVTNTVPVLTVPASPVASSAPDSFANPDASSSSAGSNSVGSKLVGPANCGPARVGVDRVGTK